MKLYEIAMQAIATADAKLAESLLMYCERKHGLNYVGFMEYLTAHDVSPAEFQEALKG